jgi:hypothetical protein
MLIARFVALAALTTACVSHPTPCAAANACSDGLECLANRCVPVGGEPVPQQDQRQLLQLEQVGVWSRAQRDHGLPPTVVLGEAGDNSSRFILRFAAPSPALQIDAAFLLLYPLPDAPPAGRDLQFQFHPLSAPWSGDGAPQQDGRIAAVGRMQPAAPFPLRIDVTELVQRMQQSPRQNYGFLIDTDTTTLPGASYQTGTAGGAPQLEVYAHPAGATP